MGRITRWNRTATMQVELAFNGYTPNPNVVGGFVRDIDNLTNDSRVSDTVADILDGVLVGSGRPFCGDEQWSDEPADLFIEFRSEGYDDPGCTYGPIEKCYPPEGEDERTLIGVRFVFGDDSVEIPLTDEQQQAIFDEFEAEIENYEIEDDSDDWWDRCP